MKYVVLETLFAARLKAQTQPGIIARVRSPMPVCLNRYVCLM